MEFNNTTREEEDFSERARTKQKYGRRVSSLSLSLSLSLPLRYASRQSARVLGYECAFVTTKFGRDRARFAGIYVLHGV